jgi:hypothetical protein
MADTPCRDECNYLIRLADRLAGAMPDAEEQLRTWNERASDLLRSAALESLQGEAELEQLSLQLRAAWLRHANRISSRYLKSPPHFQVVRLPSGEKNPFPYDRWYKPWPLEARAARFRGAPAGWTAEQVMFNSGMATVICLLQVMRVMYQPSSSNPLLLAGVGGYFEIMGLMQDMQDELLRFRIYDDPHEFLESVARDSAQLVYIEPVYTQAGGLRVLDLEGFLEAWQHRTGKIATTLVLDTTFVGNRLPVHEMLARLGPHRPRVVIQISSLLKLDQEGLEFSNAGLMTVYSTSQEIATGIGKRMRKFRAAMGLGLTQDQATALDYPGFLDPERSERHAAAVFRNNALLAQRLETGMNLLFTGKSHPSLQPEITGPLAIAPFVNVFLRPDTSSYDRELLKHAMHAEAARYGIGFQPGSSFGFRSHRVETSIQSEVGVQVIRVAMGCRTGPSLEATIKMLNEISRMASFDVLRERYPRLAEVSRRLVDQP